MVCHTIRDRYEDLVELCPDNAVIVECGCLVGNTASFILHALEQANKNCLYYTIDNFQIGYFNPGGDQVALINSLMDELGLEANPSNFRPAYEHNLKKLNTYDKITTLEMDVFDAINTFEDNSVFCVFIDDDHNDQYVERELKAWLPKMRRDGIIIGDDYCDVRRPYNEIFPNHVHISNKSGYPENGCIIFLKDFYNE